MINNPPANEGDTGPIPWLGQEDPLEWQLASVFLSGKFHGQRSLAGYSPWGLSLTWLSNWVYTHACIHTHTHTYTHTHTHTYTHINKYSWASLAAQIVKNLPAKQETWAQSLCLEDPLEGGVATHFSILAWGTAMDRGAWQATVHRVSNWASKHSTQHIRGWFIFLYSRNKTIKQLHSKKKYWYLKKKKKKH